MHCSSWAQAPLGRALAQGFLPICLGLRALWAAVADYASKEPCWLGTCVR